MIGLKDVRKMVIGVALLSTVLHVPSLLASSSLPLSSPKYDFHIYQASKLWLPEIDAVFGSDLFKALLYQESAFNTRAVSGVGAKGLGQFMPATWDEVVSELGYSKSASPFDALKNINASAYYLSKQIRQWSNRKRSITDKFNLGAASYNAGLGNILKAQKKCGNAAQYDRIIPCLPSVTGHHSKETINYVKNIWSHWTRLNLGLN